MKPSLLDILSDMPRTVPMTHVISEVNRYCGVKPNDIPSPLDTYGWSEIFDGMRTLGFVADGKGTWRK